MELWSLCPIYLSMYSIKGQAAAGPPTAKLEGGGRATLT